MTTNSRRTKLANIFDLHQKLDEDLTEWCKNAVSAIKAEDGSTEHREALMKLCAIGQRAYRAIGVLCERGYGSEAVPLVRKILEGYFLAKWIRLKPQLRAPLFNALPAISSVVQDQRVWKYCGENPNSLHFDPNSDDTYSKMVNELIDNVSTWSESRNNGFKTLETISNRLVSYWDVIQEVEKNRSTAGVQEDLKRVYNAEYRPLCEFSHGTGSNIGAITVETKSATVFTLGPSDSYIPQAVTMGTKYLCWLLWDIAHVFGNPHGVRLYTEIVQPILSKKHSLSQEYGLSKEVSNAPEPDPEDG